MKYINEDLIIQICLWGVFSAALVFTVINGISVFGVMATVGVLLLAVDFPRKNKRNK